MDRYTNALISQINQWGGKLDRPIDTVYLGGGTPSLLNQRLIPLLKAVSTSFNVLENAEITLEINPSCSIEEVLQNAKAAKVNRLSIGAQSGLDRELLQLGRAHTVKDTATTVRRAKDLGFSNISLDLMLGLPDSDLHSLRTSLDFFIQLDVPHISAYILKIEPHTAFYSKASSLNLPDDDAVAQQYLFMCDYLKKHNYRHYEISNFCKIGFEGKHNLKYWHCEEYLGLGAAAHSFLNGKRFYFKNDLKGFINNADVVDDGVGGDISEKIMLALRLDSGFEFENRLPKCSNALKKNQLAEINGNRLSLTDKGMLVSNAVISEILEEY